MSSPYFRLPRLCALYLLITCIGLCLTNKSAFAQNSPASATGNGKLALGLFVNDPQLGGSAPGNQEVMDNFAGMVGGKPALWHWFADFSAGFDQADFDAVSSRGYTPVLSWSADRRNGSEIGWNRVAAGDVDSLVREFARAAKAWNKPLILRPEWEMNIRFNSTSNTPQAYINMWRRLHNIFDEEGATNVLWFWCPNEGGPAIPFVRYYPGDAYVDYIGFDTYNWGTQNAGYVWEAAAENIGPIYEQLTELAAKPIIIGEIGSSEIGGNKAAWIKRTFLQDIPEQFPRIVAVLYFNNNQDGEDWRVNTSIASLNAFKEVISSSVWSYSLP